MKVSIVMCSFNVSRFIDRAIKSIQNQTYTNWELILSDDASTDDTVEKIKCYLGDKRIKLYCHPKNLGYVANKNFGLQQATGDLVTQLDSDDVCAPSRIEEQIAAFQTIPDLQACVTGADLINESDQIIRPFLPGENRWINDLMVEYPFSLISIMMRPHLWAQLNYYHPFFAGTVGEDHYLVWKANQRFPIYFINKKLMSYRMNFTSVTHTFDNPRKLIGALMLEELRRQMIRSGTDWLERGELDLAYAYEKQLLNDSDVMAERYRIWAARAVDKNNFQQARYFLWASLKQKLLNRRLVPTIAYYVRHRFSRPTNTPTS